MNPEKTGIQEKDIEEIIFCHTSSNLSAGEDIPAHADRGDEAPDGDSPRCGGVAADFCRAFGGLRPECQAQLLQPRGRVEEPHDSRRLATGAGVDCRERTTARQGADDLL